MRQIDHDASAHRWGRELLAPETVPRPDLLDRPILAEVGTDHPVTCDQVAGALASGMSHHVVRDGALREATLGVVETFRLEGKWLPTFAIGLASAQPMRENRSIEGCLSYCPLFRTRRCWSWRTHDKSDWLNRMANCVKDDGKAVTFTMYETAAEFCDGRARPVRQFALHHQPKHPHAAKLLSTRLPASALMIETSMRAGPGARTPDCPASEALAPDSDSVAIARPVRRHRGVLA